MIIMLNAWRAVCKEVRNVSINKLWRRPQCCSSPRRSRNNNNNNNDWVEQPEIMATLSFFAAGLRTKPSAIRSPPLQHSWTAANNKSNNGQEVGAAVRPINLRQRLAKVLASRSYVGVGYQLAKTLLLTFVIFARELPLLEYGHRTAAGRRQSGRGAAAISGRAYLNIWLLRQLQSLTVVACSCHKALHVASCGRSVLWQRPVPATCDSFKIVQQATMDSAATTDW